MNVFMPLFAVVNLDSLNITSLLFILSPAATIFVMQVAIKLKQVDPVVQLRLSLPRGCHTRELDCPRLRRLDRSVDYQEGYCR